MLNEQYEKWKRFAPLAFLIIGIGLALSGKAIAGKTKGGGWFIQSVLGMIILGIGVELFGESVKAKTLYETELNKLKKAA